MKQCQHIWYWNDENKRVCMRCGTLQPNPPPIVSHGPKKTGDVVRPPASNPAAAEQ